MTGCSTAVPARVSSMPEPFSLTVLILTRDEAQHIARAIASVAGIPNIDARIVVVDSGSTDGTREIAAAHGAEVLEHGWVNYATQFNWAIDNAAITSAWTLRLDADEIILPELATALRDFLGATTAAGVTINRQIHFLGRWLRWGTIYPVRTLRLWRTGQGRCEDRWMDEHILVDGTTAHLDADIADINLNNIGWWTDKHNRYATRLAVDELLALPDSAAVGAIGAQARVKRFIKHKIYARLPLGGRAVAMFVYRYVFRLGFLDGWQGLVFHGLQGLWYRFLVDVKIREIRDLMAARGQGLNQVVEEEYGLRLSPADPANGTLR